MVRQEQRRSGTAASTNGCEVITNNEVASFAAVAATTAYGVPRILATTLLLR